MFSVSAFCDLLLKTTLKQSKRLVLSPFALDEYLALLALDLRELRQRSQQLIFQPQDEPTFVRMFYRIFSILQNQREIINRQNPESAFLKHYPRIYQFLNKSKQAAPLEFVEQFHALRAIQARPEQPLRSARFRTEVAGQRKEVYRMQKDQKRLLKVNKINQCYRVLDLDCFQNDLASVSKQQLTRGLQERNLSQRKIIKQYLRKLKSRQRGLSRERKFVSTVKFRTVQHFDCQTKSASKQRRRAEETAELRTTREKGLPPFQIRKCNPTLKLLWTKL